MHATNNCMVSKSLIMAHNIHRMKNKPINTSTGTVSFHGAVLYSRSGYSLLNLLSVKVQCHYNTRGIMKQINHFPRTVWFPVSTAATVTSKLLRF